MAPFHFLFQEHIGDLIRHELRFRSRWVPALDQGQFHPLPTSRVLLYPRLGQAAAKNLSRHVFEFTPLLHGTDFHGAQEILGEIESRLHLAKIRAFQLYGNPFLWRSFFWGPSVGSPNRPARVQLRS
jgi:hypothetical protein